MNSGIDIQQRDEPSLEEATYVSRQFREYNDSQAGSFPSKDIHLFAYAEDGQIVGGLFGDVSWGWLHVDVLWVDERYRGHGIGSDLMDRSETEARAMGVRKTYLETTDFQALEFYTKRGYEVFAELHDQPPGHVCYYMKKAIPTK
jgi:ribosomal protein S18 acetylase RimI-like enzyme